MPGVDGIEFCRRVRSHSLIRHTPLIFLSGWDDYKDRYRGLEAGADEYLSKETPVRELMIRIQLVLKRYSDIGGRGFKGPGMEGRLEIIGMPGLLQMCGLGRLTGVLSVGAGGRPAVVRFRDGEVVVGGGGWAHGSRRHLRAPVLDGRQLLVRPRRGRGRARPARPSPSCCSRAAGASTSGSG